MLNFLRRLIRGTSSPSPASQVDFGPHDDNPVATASITGHAQGGLKASAGAWECEDFQPEYEAFWATFCRRPNDKLADCLAVEGHQQLQSWLHWRTREAEPKAIVRLMLGLMNDGQSIWEQPGISLYLDGRWSQGGGPSPASDEGLAFLARVLHKPIQLYFTRLPGSPMQVNRYEG